jgi:hypothetical protein
MRFRGLLVALAAALVLGGLVYWSSKAKKDDAGTTAATSPKILSVPEDQITRIEVKRTGGEATVVERREGKWEVTAPEPLRADQDAISSMISTVSSLASDQLVEEKAPDLKEFGLAAPAVEVVVTQKDGKSRRVLIGDETPTSGGFFAKLADDPRVFTIASYNKTSIDKTAKDLRDKRLLTFDQDKLSRVELAAKGQQVEFGKNNQNEWQIVRPRPLRADGGQVEELIRRLRDARMETDEDAKKAAAGFNSGTQVALARVTDASGTQELTIRRDKNKDYYAKSSVTEGVHKIGSDIGDALDKGLDDFRNKKLFDFGWTDPGKVEVRDGDKTYAWQKTGENWLAGARKMDSSSVQTVIDKLRELGATKFPETGFTTPAMEVTVTSNEGKRVEKVQFAGSGKSWIVRRENEPSLYEIDSSAVEDLRKAIAGVKEAEQKKK